MEISGRFHASAVLSHEREPVDIESEGSFASKKVWTSQWGEKLLPLLEIVIQWVTVGYWLSYPGFICPYTSALRKDVETSCATQGMMTRDVEVAKGRSCWPCGCSDTEIFGSSPALRYGCTPRFCVFVMSCVGRGLAMGRSPDQGILPVVYTILHIGNQFWIRRFLINKGWRRKEGCAGHVACITRKRSAHHSWRIIKHEDALKYVIGMLRNKYYVPLR
jgi:hypothetical protein